MLTCYFTGLQKREAGWENISLSILLHGVCYSYSIELHCQNSTKSDYQISLLFLAFKSLPHWKHAKELLVTKHLSVKKKLATWRVHKKQTHFWKTVSDGDV